MNVTMTILPLIFQTDVHVSNVKPDLNQIQPTSTQAKDPHAVNNVKRENDPTGGRPSARLVLVAKYQAQGPRSANIATVGKYPMRTIPSASLAKRVSGRSPEIHFVNIVIMENIRRSDPRNANFATGGKYPTRTGQGV